MRLLQLIKKIQATSLILLLSSGTVHAVPGDSIGELVESIGIGNILREKEKFSAEVSLPVELLDNAQTGNGRMKIKFLDETELSLTEHSLVEINTYVYDPDPSKSKMAMNFVQGTARFATGGLGLVPKENIVIETPTATIGIRGTDFTTTVDELGRSLVILLPDVFGNPSGEITVSNIAGTVVLNEAYQATMVSTLNSVPTTPVTVTNISVNTIDNMFIVNPPQEVRDRLREEAEQEANKDQGILDIDFLEFNELDQDALKEDETDLEFTELDIDLLDVDFLKDLLDVIEELDRAVAGARPVESTSTGQFGLRNATIGFNSDSQYNIFQEDNGVVFYRNVNGVIRLKLPVSASVKIMTRVEGYEGIIDLNDGEDSIIVINQGP